MAAKERPRESENLRKLFIPQFPSPAEPIFLSPCRFPPKAWLRSSLGGAVVYSSGDVDDVK